MTDLGEIYTNFIMIDHGTKSAKEYIDYIRKSVHSFARGAVIEWLERLNYGAESRREFEAGRRLENSVNPAVNGYLFQDTVGL